MDSLALLVHWRLKAPLIPGNQHTRLQPERVTQLLRQRGLGSGSKYTIYAILAQEDHWGIPDVLFPRLACCRASSIGQGDGEDEKELDRAS